MDLFEHHDANNVTGRPLADRMRPRTLDEIVGQEHLLAPGKVLAEAVRRDQIPSMVLWGPPGTGKTTLAQVVAQTTHARFEPFSAVLGGVPELRKILTAAAEKRLLRGERTVLFVDEIHRFNKAQQDALLPHVERGAVTLIGATTENPSFAVNSALLSRARVFRLEPLSEDSIVLLLERALMNTDRGLASSAVEAPTDVLKAIAKAAQGDARRALQLLEVAVDFARGAAEKSIRIETIEQAAGSSTLLYDRAGEEHYNVVSAFIKSMRGSDPDAAIYWMMRMLEAGEDPLFVARRLVIFASEDVGNADPRALELAVAADAALQRLGMPEGTFALAQACTYLACAPKSHAASAAWMSAKEAINASGPLPVPMKLRNAATSQMKEWGYGEGYRNPHKEGGFARGETYLPEKLIGARYYEPTNAGLEQKIRAHLERLRS